MISIFVSKARLKGVWKFVAHNNAEGTTDSPGSYVNIATNSNLRVNRPKVCLVDHPRHRTHTEMCMRRLPQP